MAILGDPFDVRATKLRKSSGEVDVLRQSGIVANTLPGHGFLISGSKRLGGTRTILGAVQEKGSRRTTQLPLISWPDGMIWSPSVRPRPWIGADD
ncbi:hypothetical protein NKH57_29470 [Mesorhizobium sp. M1050]|uniref:hypothetical protein n=1 Tax=unclassified Mesorhizobium TaxID=325217 RepID=UPI0033359429